MRVREKPMSTVESKRADGRRVPAEDLATPERMAVLRGMWQRARGAGVWPRTTLPDLAEAIGRDISGTRKALLDPPQRPMTRQHCEMLIGFLKGRGVSVD
jgi:hypothetical protein